MYSCDHFVTPQYKLGNIGEKHMIELGQDKLDTLPKYCRECEVSFACHSGCPKDRFITTPDGELGLNYRCAGYKIFFNHIDKPMNTMSLLHQQNRTPAEIMRTYTGK